jgi:23S rRNA (guanosine2251-2'-O)-methyltransferase
VKRILVGLSAIEQAARGKADALHVVYVDGNERVRQRAALEALAARGIKLEERAEDELARIAGQPATILAITGEYPYVELEAMLSALPERPLLVALDEISDPHNFGAIVRSAVAFGADGIITLRERAAPVTKVVVRASAGATELTRIARVTNLARSLRMLIDAQGFDVFGLDGGGDTDIRALPPQTAGRVLVVGSEGRGMRRLVREQCNSILSIPMQGPTESLNASVAAGIALYELARVRA